MYRRKLIPKPKLNLAVHSKCVLSCCPFCGRQIRMVGLSIGYRFGEIIVAVNVNSRNILFPAAATASRDELGLSKHISNTLQYISLLNKFETKKFPFSMCSRSRIAPAERMHKKYAVLHSQSLQLLA
ncbi:hypothetical protein JTB14_000480 [Gonioctena quinquepunctata]|nr:hypothetical protein JTB14_000480 [Gonioctena quinquepunctata]